MCHAHARTWCGFQRASCRGGGSLLRRRPCHQDARCAACMYQCPNKRLTWLLLPQGARMGRQLQQVVPEIPPIPAVGLPVAVTNLLSSLGIDIGTPPAQQSTSLQSAGATAAASPAPAVTNATAAQPACTATFAEVLGSEPELFFLSSALQLSGFANRLPSPSLGLTIFAPTNGAFLDLLDSLSAHTSIPLMPCYSVHAYWYAKPSTSKHSWTGGLLTGSSFVACETLQGSTLRATCLYGTASHYSAPYQL